MAPRKGVVETVELKPKIAGRKTPVKSTKNQQNEVKESKPKKTTKKALANVKPEPITKNNSTKKVPHLSKLKSDVANQTQSFKRKIKSEILVEPERKPAKAAVKPTENLDFMIEPERKPIKSTLKPEPLESPQEEAPQKGSMLYLEESSSESSSSEEDSDDEFTLDGKFSSRKRSAYTSSSEDDECEELESDFDDFVEESPVKKRPKSTFPKKRGRKPKNVTPEEEEESDIEMVDDFDSLTAKLIRKEQEKEAGENGVKERKVRKQRRKLRVEESDEPKRRRINRSNLDLTTPYTSGTFIEYIPTVNSLLTPLRKHRDVDHYRLNLLENGLDDIPKESDDNDENVGEKGNEAEEKDNGKVKFGPVNKKEETVDEIMFGLIVKQKHKIAKQTKSQVTELPNNPFAEKLAGYEPHPSISGNYRSLLQSYHPDMLTDYRYYEAPSILVWNRPFDYLIHQPKYLDINRDAKRFVDEAVNHSLRMREEKLLAEVKQRASEINFERRYKQYAERERKPFISHNLAPHQFQHPLLVIGNSTPMKTEMIYEDEVMEQAQEEWIDELDDIQIIDD